MDHNNNIQVFQTATALTEAIAGFIIHIAKKAIAAKGRYTMVLSGGHTPEQLYSLLAQPPYREQIDWDKTFIFWGDERCVPLEDKDNNAHMAKVTLLDHIKIPAANIYPILVDLPPAEAADRYERTISKFFNNEPPRFDLILLGLGENGHTASLFPGTDVVFEKTRLVKEVYVAEQKMFRITMTASLIGKGDNIIFLVEGAAKTDVLKQVIEGPYEPEKLPAQLIKPVHGHLYWFLDKAAAASLSS